MGCSWRNPCSYVNYWLFSAKKICISPCGNISKSVINHHSADMAIPDINTFVSVITSMSVFQECHSMQRDVLIYCKLTSVCPCVLHLASLALVKLETCELRPEKPIWWNIIGQYEISYNATVLLHGMVILCLNGSLNITWCRSVFTRHINMYL